MFSDEGTDPAGRCSSDVGCFRAMTVVYTWQRQVRLPTGRVLSHLWRLGAHWHSSLPSGSLTQCCQAGLPTLPAQVEPQRQTVDLTEFLISKMRGTSTHFTMTTTVTASISQSDVDGRWDPRIQSPYYYTREYSTNLLDINWRNRINTIVKKSEKAFGLFNRVWENLVQRTTTIAYKWLMRPLFGI